MKLKKHEEETKQVAAVGSHRLKIDETEKDVPVALVTHVNNKSHSILPYVEVDINTALL